MRKLSGVIFHLALTLSLTLTGCSSGNTDSGKMIESRAMAATTPIDKGTLVVARLSDAENLDPLLCSSINAASVFHHTIYEGLIKRDKNMEFQPMLAKEWKQIDDTTWEFTLRQGVIFHDGTPFTAKAVKKTFDRVLDKAVASPKAGLYKVIRDVKAVDDFTVQFLLSEPFSPLLSILANHESVIISPQAIDQYGFDLSENPVGTGPFQFESWISGQDITLARNENYWGDKPKLEKVVYKVVPEDATRIAMVETGEAHIAEPIPVTEIDRIEASETMDIYRSEAMGTEFIGFNFTRKPFDDMRVRKAINYAIESDVFLKGIFHNVGSKAKSVIPSKVLGHHPGLKGYEYNINKAKELLAEAGYPNGFKTSIWTMDQKERVKLAEVLQSQLKGIGIEAEVRVLEYGAFTAAAAKGEPDMFISSWRNATGDADYIQFHLFHSSSRGKTANYFFYNNPEVDQLIEAGRKEKNIEKRKEIYAKIQEIEVEEAVFAPVRYLENIAAVRKNVRGLYMSPSNYLMINEVTIQ